MRPANIILLLLSAIAACADPIISTSVTCQIYGQSRTIAQSSCSQGLPPVTDPPPPYAAATSSATVSLPQSSSDWFTVSLLATGNTTAGGEWYRQNGIIPESLLAIATANNSIHFDLMTDGSPRAGLLEWRWRPVWLSNSGDFFANLQYSLGGYSGFCMGRTPNCSGPGVMAPLRPFSLGSQFSFDANTDLGVDTLDMSLFSNGYAGMDLQFRLFEADGVTPVIIRDAMPEPSVFLLVCLGIVAMIGYKIKSPVKAITNARDVRGE